MACISPWPRIGLSTYIVCSEGASKPVSHMSRTSTIRSGSAASRNRFARASRRDLLRMCGCQSAGSDAEPVITTLIAPRSSSSWCQSGRAQPHQLAIQLHADTPAHAHHHRLAVHRLQALLEVFDDVPSDELQALLGADDS